ncbi:LPD1 domain-containing protein [Enterococcus sp. DIV2381]|uniref:LPD1 domain-containing protein n=1 Tax=unclassified Enterococcus TaxID=2608891 RepID=UPI003D2DFD8C
MENQLTSLLKKKYGTTTSSPLVFTEKDTLYTAFRKLADNIYKNGTWTQEDELRAVDTFIRNRDGYPVGKEDATFHDWNGQTCSTEVKVRAIDVVESSFLRSEAEGKKIYSATAIRRKINGSEEHVKSVDVLLDPKNKSGTKHGEFYYFSSNNSTDPSYYALGNMNRAIGYDKLQRDILKEFDDTVQELKFDRRDLERLLERLSIASYTGKKNAHLFQKNPHGELTNTFLDTLPRDEREKYLDNPSQMKSMLENNEVQGEERRLLEEQIAANWGDLSNDPTNPVKVNLDKSPYLLKEGNRTTYLYPKTIQNARKQNELISFVEEYIQSTYDIFLQREYEKDIDKQTRASAWQTKKNINKDTRKIMESTSLNKYFQFVEIDNDVDLTLFSQFEKEMERMHDILPKTGDKLPELRLRKLGNHKALGLYVPNKNTIAIDFRDTNDEIGGVGIQSFVHEYGHALDYGTDNGRLLSMRDDFKPIVTRYRENLSLNGKGSYVAEKAGYYTAPTEVFARAFELYVNEAGLNSIFLKSKETYATNIEYALFDQNMRDKLTTFFDRAFPNLKTAVLESNKEHIDVEQGTRFDQELLKTQVDTKIESIKSVKFIHENEELNVGDALETCELSLIDQASAIQKQEEAIHLYMNAIPQTDTMEQITAILKDSLEEMKEQSEETLFLFDGSELADYSTDLNEMLTMITERAVFNDVYGNSLQEVLLEVEVKAEQAHQNISAHAQALIDSKAVTPGEKNPTLYFVKGLNTVALELQETGDFLPSEKYKPQTETEKEVIGTLLRKSEVGDIKVRRNHNNKIGDQPVEGVQGVNDMAEVQLLEERKSKKYIDLGNKIVTLKKERIDFRDQSNWEKVSETDWELRKLNLAVETLDKNTIEPILSEIAEFEIDIAGLESIDRSNVNLEQSNSILERINRSKGYIKELKEMKDDYSNFYQQGLEEEIKSSPQGPNSLPKEEQQEQDQSSSIVSSNEQLQPSNHSFIQEINVSFDETKQEVDAFLKQVGYKGEQFGSMADIENILATHLKQVETIVKQSIEAVDALSEPTENQIKEETTKVKRTIGQILSDFKENLKQYVRTQKNNTVYQVTNKMDDIRLGFKNSFNRKILSINGLLKQLSNTIDRKFIIEEKRNQSPLAEETKEVQENDSKEATQKEQEKVSEGPSAPENQVPTGEPETQPNINTEEKRDQVPLAEKTQEVQENDSQEAAQKEQEKVSEGPMAPEEQSPTAEPETQPTINTAESVSDPNKQHSEEPTRQNEPKLSDEGNAPVMAEEAEQSTAESTVTEAEKNQADKKMNNIELQQLKRIEDLSNQLGLKASEKQTETIKDLTQTQKSELIRSMEVAVEEKNKSVSVKETETELEVG